MKVNIKKLTENAVIPRYGSEYSAGADLYSTDVDVKIAPGETRLIHTGIAVEIPEGLVGLIYARSGLASKKGITLANCVGVVDSDYTGEIKVALINLSNEEYTLTNGERIAQMVIMPVTKAKFTPVEELDETERGSGGFGSTGAF